MRLRLIVILLVLSSFTFLATHGSTAADRTLYWQDFSVIARLDNEGRLHIREQQTIVFDGAWNGGERIFTVHPGQLFTLGGLYRTTADGQQLKLQRGNLSEIDTWNWHGERTLRWRSRLTSDPPFRSQPITYTIEYSLGRILSPTPNGKFSLSHDFAFSDRTGSIHRFSLDFTADDAWEQDIFPVTVQLNDLAPGQGVVVTKALVYLRGRPPLVYKKPSLWPARPVRITTPPAPAWLVVITGLIFLLILLACSISFFRHERKQGRFADATDPAEINEEWLKRNVFRLLPETVGATWDKKTAGPEVAAVLARLVLEEKISSRLEPVVIPILNWPIPGLSTLYLRLLKPRREFTGYEQKLIEGFFVDGDTTDTRRIRAYYRKEKRSFLPSEEIRDSLEKRVKRLTGALKDQLEYRWLLLLAGCAISFFIFLTNCFLHQEELPLTLGGGIGGIISLIAGSSVGYNYRCRSDVLIWRIATLFFIPMLMAAVFPALLFLGASSLLTCGFFFLFGSVLYAIFYNAKTRDSLEGVKLCQTLTRAQRFFRQELHKEKPAIKDDWYPYLLAFGLGPEVDRWTRSFPARGVKSALGGRSSPGDSGGFSGGGGSFGGAGASGSWAAAATSLGSSASSSSSSSGGGGGGSSGGGGGGGW